MQKLYTKADIEKAFFAGSTFNISYADYIKRNKGKNGIFKSRMKKILAKHLQRSPDFYIDPEHQPKTIVQRFYKALTK